MLAHSHDEMDRTTNQFIVVFRRQRGLFLLIHCNVPVLISLQDVNLLQGLEDLAGNGAGRLDVVGRAGTAVLGTTVDLLQGTDTDTATEVDVAGNAGY